MENNKKETILKYLKKFFDYYGQAVQFECDNGREFVNDSVKEYLTNNNITMINGRPYNPRKQGIIGRVQVTIRKSLISKYLEDIKYLNLKQDLIIVVSN